MGDFNSSKTNWSVPCNVTNHTAVDSKLLFVSQRCGLKQLVCEQTHVKNLAYLIIVSNANFVLDVIVSIPFSTSDHASVKLYEMFDACDNLTDDVNKTLPPSDKLDF